ncbi:hypothetical protein K4K59_008211 [Colletotrichum sp. SAR11_240]|nr:hypothetical protein K4K59_008211 [Colletotrichum sp. SAR11_240]
MVTEIFIDKANLVLQAAANHPYLAALVYLASMAISRVWHSARFAECWPPGPPPPEVDQPKDLATEDARVVKEVTDADAQLQQHSVENAALIEEITKLKERANLKEAQTEQHSAENARLTEEVASLKEKLQNHEKTERLIASFKTKVASVPQLRRPHNYNIIPKSRQYGIYHVSEGRVFQPPSEATEKQLSLSKILTVANTTPAIALLTVTDNAPIATIESAIPASDVVSIDEDSAREDESNDNVHEEAQDEGETEKEENQVTKSDEKNEVEKEQEHEDENKTDGEDERDQDAKKDDDGDDDDKDDHHDLGGGGAVLTLPDHSLSASSIPAPPEQPTTPHTNVLEQVHTFSTELPVPDLPTLALKSPATHKRRLSDPEEPQRSGHGPASRPIPTESSTLPSISSSATVASALVTAQLPTFGNAPGSSAIIAPNAQVDDNEAMEVVETQPSDKTEGSEKDNGYLMDGVVGEPTVAVERVAETPDGSMDGVIQQAPPVAIVGINDVHGDAMEVIEVETNQDARNMMEGVTQFETTTRDDQEMADAIGSAQDLNIHQYADRDMHDNFSSVTPAVEIVDTDMQNDPFFTYTPHQPATQVAIDREIEMDILEDLRPELPATPGEFGPIDEIFEETLVEAGPSSPPLILSPTIPDEFYAHPPPMPLRKSKDTGCAKLGPDGRVIRSPAARPPEAPKTPTSVKVLAPKRVGSAADPKEASRDAPRISIFSISDPMPAPASDPQQPSQATRCTSNRAQAKEKRNQEEAVQTGDTPVPSWFSQHRQILPLPRSNRANRSEEDIANHQRSVHTARRELEQEVEASQSQEAAGGEDGHRDRIVRVVERAEQNQSESVFTYGGGATTDERLAVLRLLFDILGRRDQDTGTARKFKRWGGQKRLKLLSKERWQDLPGAPEDQKTFLTREQVNDLLGRWMR